MAVCISKDLSRLGRNSALTGLYTNFTFPQYGVRYIAINDNFDTINPNFALAKEKNIKLITTALIGKEAPDALADFTFNDDGTILL